MLNDELERYHLLYSEQQDAVLRPGDTFSLEFDGVCLLAQPSAHRLFFTGETVLFHLWKSEPDYPSLYRLIDDALDYANACKSRYCLNLSSPGLDYAKLAYHKVIWKPTLSYVPLFGHTQCWTGGIYAKAEDLAVPQDGFLRMVFEVRRGKAGVSRHSVAGLPDATYAVDIHPGTYGWTEYEIPMEITDEETASVCVFIEGIRHSGRIWLERPFLKNSSGWNILPDFSATAAERQHFDWLGMNLSRAEWPEFEMKLNGRVFYTGEIFERCHRYSETEIEIPQGFIRPGRNRLELTLVSSCRDALPYAIHEIGIIGRQAGVFHIVACPEIAAAGRPFGVLIETEEPGMRLEFECPSGLIEPLEDLCFDTNGLHAVRFQALREALAAEFQLSAGGRTETARVSRIVRKPRDDVFTGTGDQIYVSQNEADTFRFLSWYMANHIGNLLTVRPVYRWSGTREVNAGLWPAYCRILNGLGMRYVHMLDGRELPGSCANPPVDLMQGDGFLGRQKHELDGAYAYGGYEDFSGWYMQELYYDMWLHLFRRMPEMRSAINTEICSENVIMRGEALSLNRDPEVPADMEAACSFFLSQLGQTRYDAVRHTGPSTLFKYFFQAGYSWTGAELMYGPMEVVIAALRGASACYGQKDFGGHLAVQWSTTPHDLPERYERYRLALYVSYIQGLTEINTEEGLWHMEAGYSAHSRFSPACRSHLKEQQDFFRYVSTHTRSGRFYAPIAFLQGRFDGWQCFTRETVWGHREMPFGSPEESWDLLKVFYPLSVLDAIYRTPCRNGPVGFYTGTPYGNADIIPAEGHELFGKYKALSFLGYHKALPDDCDRLVAYVEAGGKLLLGWPHLSVTTKRADVISCRHEHIRHPLADIAGGYIDFTPHFADDTVGGKRISVADNISLGGCRMLAMTDGRNALAFCKAIGKGLVYFVNAKEYPAEKALQPVYSDILKEIAEDVLKDEMTEGIIRCKEDVQYAVYRQEDNSRHIYLIAVDAWYNHNGVSRKAELLLNADTYPLEIPPDKLIKVVISGECAAWLPDDRGEIISLHPAGVAADVTAQGCGITGLMFARDGFVRNIQVDFTDEPIRTITVHP